MTPRVSFAWMRRLHLYLGCFFAPLLLFFVASGAWQTFMLHRSTKDGTYRAPAPLSRLSSVHMEQRYPHGESVVKHSTLFRWLVLAMSLGLAVSVVLGIAMALKLTRPLWVWATLGAGTVLPAAVLFAAPLSAAPGEGARFRLEASQGESRPTRASPIVEGTLAGVPALFVLDTGAGTHTLASWLARKARLTTRPTELKARDAAGRSLDLSMVHGVKVSISGLGAFTLEDAIVAEFPAFFEDEGIGGALSPQLLAPVGKAILLDMPASRARLEDAAVAERVARALPRSLAERGVQGCSDLAAPLANFLFQVPTLVDGADLLLTIDTGAGRTGVHAASAAGAKLEPRAVPRQGAAALGGPHEASSVPGVIVKSGAAEATLDVDLVPAKGGGSTCRADGHLGMDLLKRCVLAVSRSGFAGGCAP